MIEMMNGFRGEKVLRPDIRMCISGSSYPCELPLSFFLSFKIFSHKCLLVLSLVHHYLLATRSSSFT